MVGRRKSFLKMFIKLTVSIVILLFISLGILLVVDYHVSSEGKKYLLKPQDTPNADAIIIFGAYVDPKGNVTWMLADRLNAGYELYKAGKADRIVVTGDHGKKTYDEVNAMRKYLQNKGVPREDIFMDHAGFDTYESLYRAKEVFVIKKALLVSQEYHVKRALYIARALGLEAYGIGADTIVYPGMRFYRAREVGARFKAFAQAGVFKPKPTFLGDTIPIWSSGEMTDDGK